MRPKVFIFFVLFTSVLGFIGCGDGFVDDHVVPNVRVDVNLNLQYIDYKDLESSGQAIYVQYSHTGAPVGYLGNGIIVMQIAHEEYACYDATCTHCLDEQGIVGVERYHSSGKCRQCGILFDFYTGMPMENENTEEGVEKISELKRYSVARRGNMLNISH